MKGIKAVHLDISRISFEKQVNMLFKVVLVSLGFVGAALAALPGGEVCLPLGSPLNASLCVYAENMGDVCQWKYGIRGQGDYC